MFVIIFASSHCYQSLLYIKCTNILMNIDIPCGLRHTLSVTEGGTEEELAQYARVSTEDWTSFLIHRAI